MNKFSPVVLSIISNKKGVGGVKQAMSSQSFLHPKMKITIHKRNNILLFIFIANTLKTTTIPYSSTSTMGFPVVPFGKEIPNKVAMVGAISGISVLTAVLPFFIPLP